MNLKEILGLLAGSMVLEGRADLVDKEFIKHSRARAAALSTIAQPTEGLMDLTKISGHPHRTPTIEVTALARRRTPLMLSRAAIQIVQPDNPEQVAATVTVGLSDLERATIAFEVARRQGW